MNAVTKFALAVCLIFSYYKGHTQTLPSFIGAKIPSSAFAVIQGVQLCEASDINNDGNLDLIGVDANYVKILYTDGAGAFIGDTSYLISLNTVAECDTADLNGDGYEDLVGVSNGSWAPQEEIFVLMSDSLGLFTLTFNGDFGSGGTSTEITLNDFNNDGFTDAAVATQTQNVSVLYGDSSYGFQPYILISATTGGSGYYITSADYNNDGFADIAATFDNNRYSILLADSVAGVFQVTTHNAGLPVAGIASPDLNLDGNPDLVIGGSGVSLMNGVHVFPGTGSGLFALSISTFYNTGFLNSVGTIFTPDINGDGFPDVVLPWDYMSHNVFIGDGNFGLNYVQRGVGGKNPVFADFNNDSYLDMYANSGNGNTYGCALGDGSGLLPLAPRYHNDKAEYVQTADFNNDGYGDAISYNTINGNMGVDTGTAGAELQPAWSSNSPLGKNITMNDFNGDGVLDLATYICSSSSNVKVFIGDGNGGFAVPVSFTATGTGSGAPNSWVSSADMNEDGNCDIVYGYGKNFSNICEYGILLSDGMGGYNAPQTASVNASFGFDVLEVGLLNGDNLYDIVIHHDDTKFSVLYGNGNATYGAAQLYNTPQYGCAQIIIDHMDYDSYPDIVFATGADVDIHYGNASNTFTAPVTYSNFSGTIACDDINGDWFTDIVFVNQAIGALSIHIGDGNRNFPAPDTFYMCEYSTTTVSVIDVDDDGRKDIVDGRFALFRNISSPPIITEVQENSATATASELSLNVFPNPTSQFVNLNIESSVPAIAQISVLSISGQSVRSEEVPVQNGCNKISINLEGIAPGVYVVDVLIGEKRKSERLIVQ